MAAKKSNPFAKGAAAPAKGAAKGKEAPAKGGFPAFIKKKKKKAAK